MHRLLACPLLVLALLASPRPASPADLPAPGGVLRLLDQLRLGLSRPELVESIRQNIESSLSEADPGLRVWVQTTVNLDSLVGEAFRLHEPEWTEYQGQRTRVLAEHFSSAEIRQLSELFTREPVQRLFQVLELPDSLVQTAGDRFYTGLQGDVERLMGDALAPYLEATGETE